MNAQKLTEALLWGVRGGAITQQQASATLALVKNFGTFRKSAADGAKTSGRQKGNTVSNKLKATDPKNLNGKAADVFKSAKVKEARERLDGTRFHVKRANGSVLQFGGVTLETPSQYDRALIGAWCKASLIRGGYNFDRPDGVKAIALTDFERALLAESTKDKWIGTSKGYDYGGYSADGYIPGVEVKGLLDDSTSGGIYAAPAVLDTALITTPLLSGQLAPFVDMKPISGRRVMAPKLAQMTGGWGIAAGSAVTPMSSAGLMTSVDTPIWPYSGFLELSNELESDSPLDLGAAVIEQFGERLRSELDKVIAVGNGYNQPLGILNTSGLVAVASDNGGAGPVTVSDAESLIFGLPLQYRQGWEGSFVGNDTSYRRFRGIQVGPGDERRVFGQGMMGTDETQRYQLFEYKYRVQNDLPNSKLAFVALKKYRLYVRAGAELIRERGGRQLALSNMQLIGLRARYGGQLVDSNAAALMTDLQG